MSDHHETVVGRHVIICNVCGLRVISRTYEGRDMFKAQREHEQIRRAQGWRLFISRSRRWYCPEHGPKPGHAMYEVTR